MTLIVPDNAVKYRNPDFMLNEGTNISKNALLAFCLIFLNCITTLKGNPNAALDFKTIENKILSSTPLSRSQAREKEEGWRQEGHPAIKVVPKPP